MSCDEPAADTQVHALPESRGAVPARFMMKRVSSRSRSTTDFAKNTR